jgi:hypothetical protein
VALAAGWARTKKNRMAAVLLVCSVACYNKGNEKSKIVQQGYRYDQILLQKLA